MFDCGWFLTSFQGVTVEHLTAAAEELYLSLHKPEMGADGVALCLEAARMKQRLDQLDTILAGESEIFSTTQLESGELVMRVDAALQEARQLATVFRQVIEAIYRRWPDDGGDGEDDVLAGL